MKDDRRDTREDRIVRSDTDRSKAETKTVHSERHDSMPNPVKGLTLSLYPMGREH